MKKSAKVPATLIISIAAAYLATGCGSQECRDGNGRLISDTACQGSGAGYTGAHWVQTGGFGGSGGGYGG